MTAWSKRKRLEATIAGDKTRPPARLSLWRHWPGDDQDAEALAAAHLRWQADYDWDLLKVGPASSYSVADWGAKDRWVGHIEGTRERTYYPVQNRKRLAKAASRLDPDRGMLATQIEALRQVGKGVGEHVPFIATIFSPLSQAKNLAGHEEDAMPYAQQSGSLYIKGWRLLLKARCALLKPQRIPVLAASFMPFSMHAIH